MTQEPRKSFGFLNRAASFGVKRPHGPMFGVLPAQPPLPERDIETPLRGRPRSQRVVSPFSQGTSLSDEKSIQGLLAARKNRQASREAWMRRRYAQFDPWKGENA